MKRKSAPMTTCVAFLRGIGGTDTRIKMQVLKDAFEGLGFQNVRTVIASGNVIFETKPARTNQLERIIEKALPEAIGFGADTLVYTLAELQHLTKSSLARTLATTRKTRAFVTFLKEIPKRTRNFSGKGFRVLGRSSRAVLSIVDFPGTTTPDLMGLLAREYGKRTTTRSWKTIEKILKRIENRE